jgi:hypothetical protein
MSFTEELTTLDARIAESQSEEGFWEHVPPFFADTLRTGSYRKGLNEILIAVRDRNTPITAKHTAGQFIALHSSPWTNWSIIFHKRPAQFLYLSPVDALQARVGGTPLKVGRYSCKRPGSFDLLERDLPLTFDGCDEAKLDVQFERRGREQILDWSALDEEGGPGVTLRVNSGPLAPFEWAFDRTTLRPAGLSPIDPIESNVSTIFSLLAAVGERQSVEYLLPFLESERHFMRWNAIQAIAALDKDSSIAGLQRLADDPHPEVRAAARRSLAQLIAVAA